MVFIFKVNREETEGGIRKNISVDHCSIIFLHKLLVKTSYNSKSSFNK